MTDTSLVVTFRLEPGPIRERVLAAARQLGLSVAIDLDRPEDFTVRCQDARQVFEFGSLSAFPLPDAPPDTLGPPNWSERAPANACDDYCPDANGECLNCDEPADAHLCSDCPPVGYPTDATRCALCPRRAVPEMK